MNERYGRYLSKNLSGVMLPVNADIPSDIDVFFVDEFDPHASSILTSQYYFPGKSPDFSSISAK